MKRTILLLGLLLTTAAAAAQPRIRVEHGPYLLNVTDAGFAVELHTTVKPSSVTFSR